MPPEFAPGGLLTGPDGEDSIPVSLYPGERWYTAEQVRRLEPALATMYSERLAG